MIYLKLWVENLINIWESLFWQSRRCCKIEFLWCWSIENCSKKLEKMIKKISEHNREWVFESRLSVKKKKLHWVEEHFVMLINQISWKISSTKNNLDKCWAKNIFMIKKVVKFRCFKQIFVLFVVLIFHFVFLSIYSKFDNKTKKNILCLWDININIQIFILIVIKKCLKKNMFIYFQRNRNWKCEKKSNKHLWYFSRRRSHD